MSILEYIQNLTRLKNLAVNRWGILSEIERDIVDASFDWLIDNLDVKRGNIVVDEELQQSMDNFVKAVVDTVIANRGYQSKLRSFLGDLSIIQRNNREFHATTNKFDINIAGVNDVQKAMVNEIIDQYTGNGLNRHFAGPLRDGIFRNILAGANMKEVREVLRNHILSGEDESGKLAQYLDQTAMQSVDSYTGAINQQIVNSFTFTGYIISGSLIETSSKQCIYAVTTSEEGYLPFKEWEKVLEMARNNPKAKLIDGTTIKNLPLNKLHWGCRHDFTPIIIKEAQGGAERSMNDRIDQAEKAGQNSLEMHLDPITGDFTPERKKLHGEILDKFLAQGTRKDKVAYTLGGAPANGKSTLVNSGKMANTLGLVEVNPDEIKGLLPEYSLMTKQKKVNAAAFVHEESSMLSKQLIKRSMEQEKDFLLDGVGDGSLEGLTAKINSYKKAGYRVHADYVSLDTDKSLQLAEARGKKTNRYVPETYILEMNKEISNLVPDLLHNNVFHELNLWDTNIVGEPRLILSQKDGVLKIYNQELYEQFLKKGGKK